MICSELAAWAYRDAGVRVDVAPWWPDIEKQGLLELAGAPMDFTTPNMLSHSPDMNFVFQLWPAVPAATLVSGQIQLGEQIVFDTASAKIEEDMDDLLEEVAKVMTSHSEVTHVRVEGHTDNVGAAADNQGLSRRRADAVVEWLVAHGVAASRLSSAGFGDTRPLVPNDTEHSRRKNRRVEFNIGGTRRPAK
jgi:outer membrane protein OmpA-like peptidoglycan-associated protein